MCDRPGSRRFTEFSSTSEPKGPDHCHIYYVHQDGFIFHHPDAHFSDTGIIAKGIRGAPPAEAKSNTSRECVRGVKSEGDLINGLGLKRTESLKRVRRVTSEGDVKASLFCGDDRLTLVHLPNQIENDFGRTPDSDSRTLPESSSAAIPKRMPSFFAEKLGDICEHCHCKQEILWRNLHRDEQHFDACFRYVDGPAKSNRRCFLKLYTLRVPFLSDKEVSFSMVHHIKAEGMNFIPAKSTTRGNQEHMFAFIRGFKSKDIGKLLTDLVPRWQDIPGDHLKTSAGMTPRLFVATLLSYYGSTISPSIREVYKNLKVYDNVLKRAICNEVSVFEKTDHIRSLNMSLIAMNISLTGTRSTMHYLADSANVLVNSIIPFEEYVKARLSEWDNPDREILKKEMRKMDSCREQIRDNDKLAMVRKNMTQYKTDIKSLQQHIDINVGMVSNLIAGRDRFLQQSIQESQASIAKKASRDGANMKIVAFLTALCLPGTFMAVFLTAPIFNFLDDTKPILSRKGIPFGIYWVGTVLGFVLWCIGLFFLNNPNYVCWIINQIPFETVRKFSLIKWIYDYCKNGDDDKQPKPDEENGAEDGGSRKEEHMGNNDGVSEHLLHIINGNHGKSTSIDGTSQQESNSSAGSFREDQSKRHAR